LSDSTKQVSLTFDERIVTANILGGAIQVIGNPPSRRHNVVGTSILGRRITFATTTILGDNLPPLRCTYSATGSDIIGVGGGEVQSFADFPLTLTG
jgi:hypothetical protein